MPTAHETTTALRSMGYECDWHHTGGGCYVVHVPWGDEAERAQGRRLWFDDEYGPHPQVGIYSSDDDEEGVVLPIALDGSTLYENLTTVIKVLASLGITPVHRPRAVDLRDELQLVPEEDWPGVVIAAGEGTGDSIQVIRNGDPKEKDFYFYPTWTLAVHNDRAGSELVPGLDARSMVQLAQVLLNEVLGEDFNTLGVA